MYVKLLVLIKLLCHIFSEQFLLDQNPVSLWLSERINQKGEASYPGLVHPSSSSNTIHPTVSCPISSAKLIIL